MKIAYFAYCDVSREGGVLKKIARHINAWRDENHQVRLFALSPSDRIWSGLENLPVDVVVSKRRRHGLIKAPALVKRVIAWRPDVVYLRFDTYPPALARLVASIPTLVEVVADDLAYLKAIAPGYLYWYHRFTRGRILRKAAGMCFLTHETANRYCHDKPMVVIGDSVDLSRYAQLPAPRNSIPRLVFIASGLAPRHGLDKIFWLARHYDSWRFDLIGLGPFELSEGVPSNVILHGRMDRSRYEEIMTSADVAIGPLALHRIGMNETAPLKVREYLAYGIPTIIGYRDTDFPDPVPYMLHLPNTPDNVVEHVSAIERFVATWRGKRVAREKIAHLDVRVKEKKRLLFFHEVLGMSEAHCA